MSCYSKRSSARRSDDTMDEDGDDKDDTKRKSRNLSEKKRRDQFNMLVNELSSMVSTGARKMDKSTVLRSTISFLKNHNEIAIRSRAHEIQEDWKPAFLSNEEFTHLILEALDGFIVVFSAAGHVHYVSESVTALLGHLPSELLNTSVYELVWDEEQAALYQALVGGGNTSSSGTNGGAVAFQAHLRRARPYPAEDSYELVNFQGYLRTDVDMSETYTSADTRLFVGTARLHTPQLIREMSLVDTSDIGAPGPPGRGTPGEFTSRHSLEWKFLFLDHRAPPIIGYLPFEVLGTSGYDYYHVDDLDKVVSCHEALMQKGEGTSCYYRFLTKGQQWIWLQTRFYITYHQWNSKPEFIVCTHRVVSYVDVMKQTHKPTSPSSPTAVQDTSPVTASSAPGSATGSGTTSPWNGVPAAATPAAPPSGNAGTSTPSQRSTRRHTPRRTPSDCTSMSADSPASGTTSRPTGGRTSRLSSHSLTTPAPANPTLGAGPSAPVPTQMMYPEPQQPQYVAVPVPSAVITGFTAPPAAVLSPMPQPVDTSAIAPNDAQLQAQLQRKHAELQAIIEQQQAELRRVSEQLLMARLGLLPPVQPGQHPQQVQHHMQQPQHAGGHHQQHMITTVSVPYVCNSNVSSTTPAPGNLQPGVVVHTHPEDGLGLGQPQQMMYSQPSSSSNQMPK